MVVRSSGRYNEQKEKLTVFRRNKRKLTGDAAEKKQLYNMLECQVGRWAGLVGGLFVLPVCLSLIHI